MLTGQLLPPLQHMAIREVAYQVDQLLQQEGDSLALERSAAFIMLGSGTGWPVCVPALLGWVGCQTPPSWQALLQHMSRALKLPCRLARCIAHVCPSIVPRR